MFCENLQFTISRFGLGFFILYQIVSAYDESQLA